MKNFIIVIFFKKIYLLIYLLNSTFFIFRYQKESQTLDEFGVALVVDKKTAKDNKRKKANRCTITPLKV